MPLGEPGDQDRAAVCYPSDAIRRDLQPHWDLVPTTETTGGPARYFRVAGSRSRIGFISPHSHNFCADCNRGLGPTRCRTGQARPRWKRLQPRREPQSPVHLRHS